MNYSLFIMICFIFVFINIDILTLFSLVFMVISDLTSPNCVNVSVI